MFRGLVCPSRAAIAAVAVVAVVLLAIPTVDAKFNMMDKDVFQVDLLGDCKIYLYDRVLYASELPHDWCRAKKVGMQPYFAKSGFELRVIYTDENNMITFLTLNLTGHVTTKEVLMWHNLLYSRTDQELFKTNVTMEGLEPDMSAGRYSTNADILRPYDHFLLRSIYKKEKTHLSYCDYTTKKIVNFYCKSNAATCGFDKKNDSIYASNWESCSREVVEIVLEQNIVTNDSQKIRLSKTIQKNDGERLCTVEDGETSNYGQSYRSIEKSEFALRPISNSLQTYMVAYRHFQNLSEPLTSFSLPSDRELSCQGARLMETKIAYKDERYPLIFIKESYKQTVFFKGWQPFFFYFKYEGDNRDFNVRYLRDGKWNYVFKNFIYYTKECNFTETNSTVIAAPRIVEKNESILHIEVLFLLNNEDLQSCLFNIVRNNTDGKYTSTVEPRGKINAYVHLSTRSTTAANCAGRRWLLAYSSDGRAQLVSLDGDVSTNIFPCPHCNHDTILYCAMHGPKYWFIQTVKSGSTEWTSASKYDHIYFATTKCDDEYYFLSIYSLSMNVSDLTGFEADVDEYLRFITEPLEDFEPSFHGAEKTVDGFSIEGTNYREPSLEQSYKKVPFFVYNDDRNTYSPLFLYFKYEGHNRDFFIRFVYEEKFYDLFKAPIQYMNDCNFTEEESILTAVPWIVDKDETSWDIKVLFVFDKENFLECTVDVDYTISTGSYETTTKPKKTVEAMLWNTQLPTLSTSVVHCKFIRFHHYPYLLYYSSDGKGQLVDMENRIKFPVFPCSHCGPKTVMFCDVNRREEFDLSAYVLTAENKQTSLTYIAFIATTEIDVKMLYYEQKFTDKEYYFLQNSSLEVSIPDFYRYDIDSDKYYQFYTTKITDARPSVNGGLRTDDGFLFNGTDYRMSFIAKSYKEVPFFLYSNSSGVHTYSPLFLYFKYKGANRDFFVRFFDSGTFYDLFKEPIGYSDGCGFTDDNTTIIAAPRVVAKNEAVLSIEVLFLLDNEDLPSCTVDIDYTISTGKVTYKTKTKPKNTVKARLPTRLTSVANCDFFGRTVRYLLYYSSDGEGQLAELGSNISIPTFPCSHCGSKTVLFCNMRPVNFDSGVFILTLDEGNTNLTYACTELDFHKRQVYYYAQNFTKEEYYFMQHINFEVSIPHLYHYEIDMDEYFRFFTTAITGATPSFFGALKTDDGFSVDGTKYRNPLAAESYKEIPFFLSFNGSGVASYSSLFLSFKYEGDNRDFVVYFFDSGTFFNVFEKPVQYMTDCNFKDDNSTVIAAPRVVAKNEAVLSIEVLFLLDNEDLPSCTVDIDYAMDTGNATYTTTTEPKNTVKARLPTRSTSAVNCDFFGRTVRYLLYYLSDGEGQLAELGSNISIPVFLCPHCGPQTTIFCDVNPKLSTDGSVFILTAELDQTHVTYVDIKLESDERTVQYYSKEFVGEKYYFLQDLKFEPDFYRPRPVVTEATIESGAMDYQIVLILFILQILLVAINLFSVL